MDQITNVDETRNRPLQSLACVGVNTNNKQRDKNTKPVTDVHYMTKGDRQHAITNMHTSKHDEIELHTENLPY